MANWRIDPSAQAKIEAACQRLVEQVTEDIADDARRYVPVDTGELRNSITSETIGSVGTVTARSDHSVYVELGTRHMKAQPYLRPALFTKRSGRAS